MSPGNTLSCVNIGCGVPLRNEMAYVCHILGQIVFGRKFLGLKKSNPHLLNSLLCKSAFQRRDEFIKVIDSGGVELLEYEHAAFPLRMLKLNIEYSAEVSVLLTTLL